MGYFTYLNFKEFLKFMYEVLFLGPDIISIWKCQASVFSCPLDKEGKAFFYNNTQGGRKQSNMELR